MKKNLLMLSFCGLSIIATAQNRPATPVSSNFANKAVISSKAATLKDNGVPFKKPSTATAVVNKKTGGSYGVNFIGQEAIIGNTDYDLQSNSSSYPRLIKNPDGTMSAGWTYYPDGGSTNERGTGYNYFNGTSWGPPPTITIEQPLHRTGFINMVVTGSGQESSYAHASNAIDLCVLRTHRPAKGTGTWNYDNTSLKTGGATNTDTWARVVAGGTNENSIHCIVNSNDQGAAGGSILYSRSTDEGATWNPLRDYIPGLTPTDYPYFIGGDAYCIATKGDVVAIVVGDISTDVALFKSVDNGTTWTKTQVTNQFVGGSYNPDGFISDINGDGVADTVEVTAGDVNVTIDNAGTCHVFYGLMNILDTTSATGNTSFFVFLGTNGINYWKEGMTAPVTVAGAEDWNGNGFIDVPEYTPDPNESGVGRYGNMGMSCVPSAAVDANNNIYLSYMAVNETSDSTLYFKTHYQIYVTASTDGGTTWTTPYNVIDAGGNTDAPYFEGCYPSIAKVVDANVYIEYERDYIPGLYWGAIAGSIDESNNDPLNNVNEIVVTTIPVADFVGMDEIGSNPNAFSISQNIPNPANTSTSISISFATKSDVKVEVSTLTGQVLFSNEQGKMAPGTHVLNINTASYSPGVYFYSVTVNGEKITKKMIVE